MHVINGIVTTAHFRLFVLIEVQTIFKVSVVKLATNYLKPYSSLFHNQIVDSILFVWYAHVTAETHQYNEAVVRMYNILTTTVGMALRSNYLHLSSPKECLRSIEFSSSIKNKFISFPKSFRSAYKNWRETMNLLVKCTMNSRWQLTAL